MGCDIAVVPAVAGGGVEGGVACAGVAWSRIGKSSGLEVGAGTGGWGCAGDCCAGCVGAVVGFVEEVAHLGGGGWCRGMCLVVWRGVVGCLVSWGGWLRSDAPGLM